MRKLFMRGELSALIFVTDNGSLSVVSKNFVDFDQCCVSQIYFLQKTINCKFLEHLILMPNCAI